MVLGAEIDGDEALVLQRAKTVLHLARAEARQCGHILNAGVAGAGLVGTPGERHIDLHFPASEGREIALEDGEIDGDKLSTFAAGQGETAGRGA
jgi:hypothetical protein